MADQSESVAVGWVDVGPPPTSESRTYRTLLLAVVIPADEVLGDEEAADALADSIIEVLNEHLALDLHNPWDVSAIPAPQWVDENTMARLRGEA